MAQHGCLNGHGRCGMAGFLAKAGLSHAEQFRAHLALEEAPLVGFYARTADMLLVVELVKLALGHPAIGPGMQCARAGRNFLKVMKEVLPEALKRFAAEDAAPGPAAPGAFDPEAARKTDHT